MVDAGIATLNVDAEVENLVSFLGGRMGVFLGFKSNGSFAKLVEPEPYRGRDTFCVLSENLDRPDLSEIDYLARLYRGGMRFYDCSVKRDKRIDTKIEDMVQGVRGQAYDIARSAIQRIRELNEPHSVDGISVCLDFLERMGADARSIENERAALAEARERRRIARGYEPFDAHKYYAGLRALGADPRVRQIERGGSLVESISHVWRTGDSGPLNCWALSEDPDRRLCGNYMRSVWESSRPASDLPVQYQFVPLGV